MDTVAVSDPIILLTESAANEVKSLLSAEKDGAVKGLRVYIESGGCSGMQYGMVFDQQRDGDITHRAHGVALLVDPVSANYLKGSIVDFIDSLNGGGFKISNPNARQSCGCGKSFEA